MLLLTGLSKSELGEKGFKIVKMGKITALFLCELELLAKEWLEEGDDSERLHPQVLDINPFVTGVTTT